MAVRYLKSKKSKLYKKRKTSMSKKKTRLSPTIKSYVKRMISRDVETKTAFSDKVIYPVKRILNTADYTSIIPTVSQGLTAAGRVGNIIKCKGIYVKGLCQVDINLSGTGYQAAITSPHIYVRVMCLEDKRYTFSGLNSTAILSQNGNNISPSGIVSDLFSAIDKESIKVHYNRVFKLQNPLFWSTNTGTFQNPNFQIFKRFQFKLLKNTVLKFDSNTNNTCTNHQPQMVAFLVDPQGILASNTVYPVVLDYSSTMYYEDA